MTRSDYLQQGGHNESRVVESGKNTGFWMILTAKESSGLWPCLESHEFVYYLAVVKKALESTLYMGEVVHPSLSVFVGHQYLQHGGLSEMDHID